MFTLLTVTGAEVLVATFEDLQTAVFSYRRHVIDVQRKIEMKTLTHPKDLNTTSGKMEASIGAFLFAPNWQMIFSRYESDQKNLGGW